MMNFIWAGLILLSLFTAFFTGNISQTASAAVSGASDAVETALSLAGVMCMWTGFMEIANRSGLTDAFARLISPLLRLLFKDLKSTKAKKAISMNIAANVLGIGNAATPMGLAAMAELEKENLTKGTASDNMCMFTVLNTASIQLVPTTLLALRAAHGSENPFIIIPAVWVTSVLSVTAGILVEKLLQKRREKLWR